MTRVDISGTGILQEPASVPVPFQTGWKPLSSIAQVFVFRRSPAKKGPSTNITAYGSMTSEPELAPSGFGNANALKTRTLSITPGERSVGCSTLDDRKYAGFNK